VALELAAQARDAGFGLGAVHARLSRHPPRAGATGNVRRLAHSASAPCRGAGFNGRIPGYASAFGFILRRGGSTVSESMPIVQGATITRGPQPWQVLQRGADGFAVFELEGGWACDRPAVVEVRVASEYDQASVAGCDWQPADMLPGQRWRLSLRVPTGGLYRVESRLRTPGAEWRLTGDRVWHVAVGDLWVIAGQSNAVGYGHGPVTDPPALGVSVLGGDERWRLATHPIFDPTNTRHPANRDTGWVDVSPWLAFGREILNATGTPIGLIPTALGGSPLAAWDPGNGEQAHLYHNLRSFVTAAGGRVAGVVWYQGCSDTGSEAVARSYLERFSRLVAAIREEYGAGLPILTAQLNRYLDNPAGAPNERWWTLVREAQRQAARRLPRLAVIPTLDLPLSDAIHTSAVGNVILGQRFACVALGLVYGRPGPWQPVDLHSARFADSARESVRLQFAPVSDHLVCLCLKPADVVVEDETGPVPVCAAKVEEPDSLLLSLARPAAGRTLCHSQFGTNPPSTLRDSRQWPVLAFAEAEVQ
jgi:hypothetical protein